MTHPTWGDKPPRIAGSIPRMRPDQELQVALTRAGSGPAPASPVIVARRVIVIGPSGALFVYSPTVGVNNLLDSIAAQNGTDSSGNAYLRDIVSYFAQAGTFYALQHGGIKLHWLTAPAVGGPYTEVTGLFMNPASTPVNVLTLGLGVQPFLIKAGTGGASPSSSGVLEVAGLTTITSGGLSVTGGETADTIAVSSGQAAGSVLKVTNTTSAPTNSNVQIISNASADNALGIQVAGDTANRLRVAPGNANGAFAEGPGNASQDVLFGRTAANRFGIGTADLDIYTIGRGLRVAEGSNAKQGIATLSGGTILVANTSVTANSRIMLTPQDNSTTGALRVSARVAGTSFTITSSNAGDSGVVAYQIFEPG